MNGWKGEPWSGREQLSGRRNQCATFIDRSARFVPQQVGRDVADAERSRAFDDEPFADFELAEGEVAGAGIENHVDSGEGHVSARAFGDPGVFADFHPDLHVATVESDVTDRILHIAYFDGVANAHGPGFEPTWFVVESLACQEPFGDEAEDFTVGGQAGGIEEAALVQEGNTDRDDHAACFRHDLLKDFEGSLLEAEGVKDVFTAVAADGHLGQAENGRTLAACFFDGGQDVRSIVLPVERGLVQHCRGNANSSHVPILCRVASTRSSFF